MHISPIISQLTNKIQCQTLVTITQTKQARPTTTTSPIMTQTKLDRPTPITPLQQPTISNVHQPKLQPPTNPNKPTISLLFGFVELQ